MPSDFSEKPSLDIDSRLKIYELRLKSKELAISEKEQSNKFKIELIRVVLIGFFATIITATINKEIQTQQLEIERLNAEMNFINEFAPRALDDDLEKRLYFAEYLATISHTRETRERWSNYKRTIQEAMSQKASLEDRKNQLQASVSETSGRSPLTSEEIEEIESELSDLEREIESIKLGLLIPVSQSGQDFDFQFTYDIDSKIIPESQFTWRDAIQQRIGDRELQIPTNLDQVRNIMDAAQSIELVKNTLGIEEVEIGSWFRNAEYNRSVGGSSASQHLTGHAVNLIIPGATEEDYKNYFDKLDPVWGDRGGLAYHSDRFLTVDLRGYRARWTY